MKPLGVSLFSALTIPAFLLAACGQGHVVASKLERISAPGASPDDIHELSTGINSFAFDLFDALPSGSNLVFSPYSISQAFAMPYAGAMGDTAGEMAATLHYSLPAERFHPAFNALSLDLEDRPNQVQNVNEKDRFELTIANSLWAQEDWTFLPEYLDLLALNYGAGLRLVDFANDAENSRDLINKWVERETRDRISDILPPGAINPLTRLVLANAIYFKASWALQFDANKTDEGDFHLLDGSTVKVPMMEIGKPVDIRYAAGDGWQAVSLFYLGDLSQMVLVVPDEGRFEEVESTFTVQKFKDITALMQTELVNLVMPKFTFDSWFGLKEALLSLGMETAFNPESADFSAMDGRWDLFIDDAIHKAWIRVDEKGTEAAAATLVLMMMTSMMPEGINLVIDRPFFFFIQDVPTGTILFMGRLVNPG